MWIFRFELWKGAQSWVSPVSSCSCSQDFCASVQSCSCSSFIHGFPLLLCCFSSSLLLIASNCVSAETAAVSSTCNLSNPSTKFNCSCICNTALCGCSLAAYSVSWILIKCSLALQARFKLLEVAGCRHRETVTRRILLPVIWKQGAQLSLLPARKLMGCRKVGQTSQSPLTLC